MTHLPKISLPFISEKRPFGGRVLKAIRCCDIIYYKLVMDFGRWPQVGWARGTVGWAEQESLKTGSWECASESGNFLSEIKMTNEAGISFRISRWIRRSPLFPFAGNDGNWKLENRNSK